jgi:Na+(H+)/acetate symporter ActP
VSATITPVQALLEVVVVVVVVVVVLVPSGPQGTTFRQVLNDCIPL